MQSLKSRRKHGLNGWSEGSVVNFKIASTTQGNPRMKKEGENQREVVDRKERKTKTGPNLGQPLRLFHSLEVAVLGAGGGSAGAAGSHQLLETGLDVTHLIEVHWDEVTLGEGVHLHVLSKDKFCVVWYTLLNHICFGPNRFLSNLVTLKPVLNWANVCSPNILWTLWWTMIHFLIELLVHRIWFGQSKLYFILNWLVMRCKLQPELAADVQ